MARSKPEITVGEDGLPEFLRWRIVFRWLALVFGMLIDFGIEILLQQLGYQPFELPQVVRGVLVGVALGVILPTTGLYIAVKLANREIREAREAIAAGAGEEVISRERAEAVAATGRAIERGATQHETPQPGGEEE